MAGWASPDHHACMPPDLFQQVALSKRATTFAVSGSKDTTIKRWNLKPATEKEPAEGEPVALSASWTRPAHEKDINAIAVSPNDKLLVTASQDRTAKVLPPSPPSHPHPAPTCSPHFHITIACVAHTLPPGTHPLPRSAVSHVLQASSVAFKSLSRLPRV